jgi:hypothetical protein
MPQDGFGGEDELSDSITKLGNLPLSALAALVLHLRRLRSVDEFAGYAALVSPYEVLLCHCHHPYPPDTNCRLPSLNFIAHLELVVPREWPAALKRMLTTSATCRTCDPAGAATSRVW